MSSLDQLLAVIEAIYDAAMDATCWTPALDRLADQLGSSGTTVAFQDSASRFPLHHSVRYRSDANIAYAEHYRRIDPILAFASRAPLGVYTDGMVMPKAELRRLEIHSDFGLPNDMDSVMQGFAFRSPDCAGLVAAGRSLRNGTFDREHVETLGILMPHFGRAMRLQLRLGAADLRADNAAAALDHLAIGVVFVDQRSRVIRANHAAEAMLTQGNGIGVDAAGLRAATPAQTSALRRLIAQAADRTRIAGRGGALQLHRPPPRRPLWALVSPLGAAGGASFPEPRPTALVFVSDPDQKRGPSAAHLREIYNLTPTEAAVAEAIAQGQGVKDAADGLGIAISTLRWHLQRVFEKTGTARQAELVRLVDRLGIVALSNGRDLGAGS